MATTPGESYAAVDLGSNSFHMIVANYLDGRLQVIDRIKEMIRLASGLDEKQNLSEESMRRAIQCLERFGQRIREIPYVNVRAVGTNTLRQARNGGKFLSQAQQSLGHPIEIIAGREEARLVYLGVARDAYDESNKRLVVDIGGGSTELIIGRGFEAYVMESLYMGCVNVSQKFFSGGKITAKRMRKAILFSRQELESIETTYKRLGWELALGSSGTILSINDVIRNQGWSNTGITASALTMLKDTLINFGDSSSIEFEGLTDRRKPVFAGGVAVLSGVFEALELEHMDVSDGALREGLLHDLIGRYHNEDVRDMTVGEVMQRYNIDAEQAARVKLTALNFFEQVKQTWGLDKTEDFKLLSWGAQLHEIGLSIAHAQHQKHGAYIIANSDLPGFSRQDQLDLAMLVRSHRRKFPLTELEAVPEENKITILRLCVLLRLAILMHRSRFYTALPDIRIITDNDALHLHFPDNWLDNHPLTLTDLETEKIYLKTAGVTISYQ